MKVERQSPAVSVTTQVMREPNHLNSSRKPQSTFFVIQFFVRSIGQKMKGQKIDAYELSIGCYPHYLAHSTGVVTLTAGDCRSTYENSRDESRLLLVRQECSWLLLLLLNVSRMLAQAGAEFAELQLLAAGLATQCVVVIAGLFADQKDDFFFLFLGHGLVFCVVLNWFG